MPLKELFSRVYWNESAIYNSQCLKSIRSCSNQQLNNFYCLTGNPSSLSRVETLPGWNLSSINQADSLLYHATHHREADVRAATCHYLSSLLASYYMHVLCLSSISTGSHLSQNSLETVGNFDFLLKWKHSCNRVQLFIWKFFLKCVCGINLIFLCRAQERYPSTFGAAYAAFAEESLRQQSSRRREMVPSVKEICSVLEMRELETVIHCYGGATCNISINSATTVGKVRTQL